MSVPKQTCIPTLYFHHVNDWLDHYTNCPPEAFGRFMEHLASRYTTVTPTMVLDCLDSGCPLPDRPLLLTFDDAYADNLDFALPMLQRLGCTATIFVISDYVGRTNDWNSNSRKPAWHMGFSDLIALARAGFEIGSHTRSHRVLTGLSAQELEDELLCPRETLEDNLGMAINSVAYPYGFHDAAVCHVARKFYRVAFSTVKSRCTDWSRHRHALRRTYVARDRSAADLDRVISQYLDSQFPHEAGQELS
jgi:peptidoglycan/xylan/chitin deacetylase (PgdA/CDA1 family)